MRLLIFVTPDQASLFMLTQSQCDWMSSGADWFKTGVLDERQMRIENKKDGRSGPSFTNAAHANRYKLKPKTRSPVGPGLPPAGSMVMPKAT
jgi:hypothetical protein